MSEYKKIIGDTPLLKITALLLTILYINTAEAQYGPVAASDNNYKVHQGVSNFRIIYSKEYQELIPEFANYTDWFLKRYETEFAWKLDEEFVLILASTKNQIPNGFVSPLPTLHSTFYSGSVKFMDEFAFNSWLYDLLSHEAAHVYQINAKGAYGQFLHKYLKNPALSLFPPLTYTLYPHFFTPTFIIEGNATFNESRFGNGGRLHSGQYRALFLQLLKAGKVNANRLMNDHLEWPYTNEKYLVGGYLQSHLAEKHGVEKTNLFFKQHAKKEFFPFTINSSFKKTFNETYKTAIKGLNEKYKELARTQVTSEGKVLTYSQKHASFHRTDNHISFMRTDMSSELEICQWKTQSSELCCESLRIPFGRTFKYKGQWATSTYQRISPTLWQAGLFTKNYKPIEKFKNKYIFAINKKNQILYADSINSFKNVKIYKDKEYIGETQSSPFLTENGDIYYFKQNKSERHLYKNSKILTSVNGFYGKIVDVGPKQEVYFLGSVARGSALFRFHNGVIQRVHDSDTVVDAMLTGHKDQILLAEIDSESYKYRISQLKEDSNTIKKPKVSHSKISLENDVPTFLKYTYDNKKDVAIFTEPSVTQFSSTKNDKDYKPIQEIQFAGVDTGFVYLDPSGFSGFLNFRWNDPLQRYLTSFSIRDSSWNSPSVRLSFVNAKYRLFYKLIADYSKVPHTATIDSSKDKDEAQFIGHSSEVNVLAGFNYPIIKNAIWDSLIKFNYLYENENPDDKEVESFVFRRNTHKGLLSFHIRNSFSPGFLSYEPWQAWSLGLDYKIQGEKSEWKPGAQVYSGEVSFNQNIGWNFFFSSSYKAAEAQGDSAAIELNDNSALFALDPTEFNAYGDIKTENYYQLRRINTELKRPFYLGWYHPIFPIGIWRFAPLAGYFEYYGSKTHNKAVETLFHQNYYGADIELLLVHKLPIKLTFLNLKKDTQLTTQLSLNLKKNF